MKRSIPKYSILLILIPQIYVSFYPGRIVAVSLICLTILSLFLVTQKLPTQNIDGKKVLNFFLFYNAVMFIHGMADNFSLIDFLIFCSSTFFYMFMFPYYVYKVINPMNFAKLMRSYLFFGFIASLIVLYAESLKYDFFYPYASTIRIISGLYILIFFIPYITGKWKSLLIILMSINSIILNIGERFNFLNISVAFAITLLYLIPSYTLRYRIIKSSSIILFVFPIVFFILGVTGIFNIFRADVNQSDYIMKYGTQEQTMLDDTRTGIYKDVLNGIADNHAYLLGLGANGKVKTSLVDDGYDLWHNGRPSSESGMLNYIQWGGFLGFLSYYILFSTAAYFAIWKSNNWFNRSLGLWISYKAMSSFIFDDQNAQIIYFMLFVSIGLCLNRDFRQMNNKKIKVYLNYILMIRRNKIKPNKPITL